jgi:multidrug resistance protein MdtO
LPKEPLLKADALVNPDYIRFALKTTLAAFLCYFTYTSLDWFGIHTIMVTCYFVALASVGETAHKMTLRILGCVVGAALGVFALLVVMPRLTDIGELALLIGVVSFGAAWIAGGSDRVSYMGWQIALAFFLCVLDSFHPSFDLAAGRDRVVGILIGNFVMLVVFTTIWPVGVASGVRRELARAARALAAFAGEKAPSASAIEAFHIALAEARRVGALRLFEPGKRDAGAVAALQREARRLARLSFPLVALAESRADDPLDDFLPPPMLAAAVAYESAARERLEFDAGQLEVGANKDAGGRAAMAAADAWLDAASLPSLPISALAPLARRLEIYRRIAAAVTET